MSIFGILQFLLHYMISLSEIFNSTPTYSNLPKSQNGNFIYGSFQNRTICSSKYPLMEPNNLAEVEQLVEFALKINEKIKVIGNLHSATDVICTTGIPVSMSKIKLMQIHTDNVLVGAGVTIEELTEDLQNHGKTLIQIPAFKGITIGGSIGCGSHGSSLLHSSAISDQLLSLTIVDGTGKVRNISNPEHLNAFKVHLGLLGIVYSVTLKIVPLFKMSIYNYLDKEEILFNGEALKMARKHDYFQMWWFPSDHSVVVSKGDFVNVETPGNSYTNVIPNVEHPVINFYRIISEQNEEMSSLIGLRVIQTGTIYSLYGYSPLISPVFTEDGFTLRNPAVGFGHRLMASNCDNNKCPWKLYPEENGIAMDIKDFRAVFMTIKEILKASPVVFILAGFFIRFSTASEAILAIENGRTTFHIDWAETNRYDPFKKPRVGLATSQVIMQALIDRHDGRPHWGKNGLIYFTERFLQSRRNSILEFRKHMKFFDPNETFLNDFGRRILGTSNSITIDPREKYCALRDTCICKSDFDCGNSDDVKCITMLGYNACLKLPKDDIVKFLNSLPR